MSVSDVRHIRETNPLLAAVYGVFVALVISYGMAYMFTHARLGVIAGPANYKCWGPAILYTAGLNLYAMHHVQLNGFGEVNASNGIQQIAASFTVPFSIWALVPIIGLLVGGYSSAKMRETSGRWGAILPALIGGITYGVVMAGISPFISARLGWFLLAEVAGLSSDLSLISNISFRPVLGSALIFCTGFGIVFMYLGALLIARDPRERRRGKWWACAKALVQIAILLQLVIVLGVSILLFSSYFYKSSVESNPNTIVQLLPAVAGNAYGIINGADLLAEIRSNSKLGKSDLLPGIRISAYDGVEVKGKETKASPLFIKIISLLIVSVMAFAVGWAAVRWGSRDGAIPTAFRVAIMQIIYLTVIIFICNQVISYADAIGSSTISIGLEFDINMGWSTLAVLLFSFIGAYAGSRRYTRRMDGFF